MKHVFRSHSIEPDNVDREKNHLLQVASLDPKSAAEGRVLFAELKKLLVVSRALAKLVELLLMQAWDLNFLIIGTRVFMRFPGDDLFGGTRRPVADILPYLRTFEIWRDARLKLTIPVVSLERSATDAQECKDAADEARSTLAEHRSMRAGDSDTNLNDVFLQWMQRCARASEYEVMAGSVDGDVARVVLPSCSRILEPLSAPLPAPRSQDPVGRGMKVIAVRRLRLLSMASGHHLLIPRIIENQAPSPGTIIVYAKRDRRTIKHWQVVDELRPTRELPNAEVDEGE